MEFSDYDHCRRDGGGYNFGIWFAFIVIFLIVLFAFWRRHDGNEGGWAALLPAITAFLGNRGHGGCHHDQLTEILKDQARDTGAVKHDIDKNFSDLRHAIDQQALFNSKQLDGLALSNSKQIDTLAMDQMKDAHQREMAELNRKLIERDQVIMKSEILNEVQKSNAHLSYQIEDVKCRMVKRPEYIPLGGHPTVSHCHA